MSAPRGFEPRQPGESRDEFIARCKARLQADLERLGKTKGGRDLVWAHRILDRYADREAMPSIALTMACEALGMSVEAVRASRDGEGAR